MTCNLRHHVQHLQGFLRSSSPIFQPLYSQLDPLILVIIIIIVITVNIIIIIISDTKTTRCSSSLLTHDTLTYTSRWLNPHHVSAV